MGSLLSVHCLLIAVFVCCCVLVGASLLVACYWLVVHCLFGCFEKIIKSTNNQNIGQVNEPNHLSVHELIAHFLTDLLTEWGSNNLVDTVRLLLCIPGDRTIAVSRIAWCILNFFKSPLIIFGDLNE